MAYDHWANVERDPFRIRARRRFRHHVRSGWNPKGRIHKESCCKCGDWNAEAHHLDYHEPFVVVWLCASCHRKVERKVLKVYKRDIWDYRSLLLQVPALRVENRLTDVPF